MGLTEDEKRLLRTIALESIKSYFGYDETWDKSSLTPVLKESRGAFVTLHKDGRLRGCIGHITAHDPLAATIEMMAKAAAFEDPRFPPLSADELNAIDLEISVLTPLKLIKSIDEIKVGIHGLYMKRGHYSGILLPQVATEYGWDRETFLEHTCLKAGMPKDAWKDKETDIYIYSAEIF